MHRGAHVLTCISQSHIIGRLVHNQIQNANTQLCMPGPGSSGICPGSAGRIPSSPGRSKNSCKGGFGKPGEGRSGLSAAAHRERPLRGNLRRDLGRVRGGRRRGRGIYTVALLAPGSAH